MFIYVINFLYFYLGVRNQCVEFFFWFIFLQKRVVINVLNCYLMDFIYNYLFEYFLMLFIWIFFIVIYLEIFYSFQLDFCFVYCFKGCLVNYVVRFFFCLENNVVFQIMECRRFVCILLFEIYGLLNFVCNIG